MSFSFEGSRRSSPRRLAPSARRSLASPPPSGPPSWRAQGRRASFSSGARGASGAVASGRSGRAAAKEDGGGDKGGGSEEAARRGEVELAWGRAGRGGVTDLATSSPDRAPIRICPLRRGRPDPLRQAARSARRQRCRRVWARKEETSGCVGAALAAGCGNGNDGEVWVAGTREVRLTEELTWL